MNMIGMIKSARLPITQEQCTEVVAGRLNKKVLWLVAETEVRLEWQQSHLNAKEVEGGTLVHRFRAYGKSPEGYSCMVDVTLDDLSEIYF